MPITPKKKPAGRELLVQMQINRSNATAGGGGTNVAASALMSVMVTLDGAPVSNLGTNVGNGTSAISMPAGWSLFAGFNVRPHGCDTTVTEFINQGNGIYDIRLVPFANNPACTWLSGEYIYALLLQFSSTIGGTKVVLQGGTLGKLTIL